MKRAGRLKKLTARDLRCLLRAVGFNPFIATERLISECGLTCYPRTIIRAFQEVDISHFKALWRPFLKPEYAVKRLRFARKHVGKPLEY